MHERISFFSALHVEPAIYSRPGNILRLSLCGYEADCFAILGFNMTDRAYYWTHYVKITPLRGLPQREMDTASEEQRSEESIYLQESYTA